MSDFVATQWSEYQTRMKQTAEYLSGDQDALKSSFAAEMDSFLAQAAPETYPELLQRMAAGNDLVSSWQEQSPLELSSNPGQKDE